MTRRDPTPTNPKPSEGPRLPAKALSPTACETIGEFVHTLPKKPGVYRMIAADGEVLYVGKARSLRNRVAAYTQPTRLDTRLMRMVSEHPQHGVRRSPTARPRRCCSRTT